MYKQIGHMAVLGLTTSLMISGCKPVESNLKTLENFASNATVVVNSCEANDAGRQSFYKHAPIIPGEAETIPSHLFAVTRETLSAVPPGIASYFFGRRRLEIVLSKRAGDICNSAMRAAEQRDRTSNQAKPDSCWIYVPPQKGEKQDAMRIYLQANPDAIRHGLVRQFGYLYSQFFGNLSVARKDNGKTVTVFMDQPSAGAAADKVSVGTAYLADLLNSRVFSVKGAEKYLGRGAGAKLKRNYDAILQGKDVSLFNGVTMRRSGEKKISAKERIARLNAFLDYIFAEAFDSYYCRSSGKYDAQAVKKLVKTGAGSQAELSRVLSRLENTRRRMHDFFPQTFAAFIPIARDIEALSGRYTRLKGERRSRQSYGLTSSTGFGLTQDTSTNQVTFGPPASPAPVAAPPATAATPTPSVQQPAAPAQAPAPAPFTPQPPPAQPSQAPLAAVDQPAFQTAPQPSEVDTFGAQDSTVCTFYNCREQIRQSLPYVDQDPILSSWADVVQDKVNRADQQITGVGQISEDGKITFPTLSTLPVDQQIEYKQALVAQELQILQQNARQVGVEGQVYREALQNGRNFPQLEAMRRSIEEAPTDFLKQRRQKLYDAAVNDTSGVFLPLYSSEAQKDEAEISHDMFVRSLEESRRSSEQLAKERAEQRAADDAAYETSWRKKYVEDGLRKVGEFPGSMLFEFGRTGAPTAGVGQSAKEWLGGMTGGIGRFIARPIRTTEDIATTVSTDGNAAAETFQDMGAPAVVAYPAGYTASSVGRPVVALAEEADSFITDGGETRVDFFKKEEQRVTERGSKRFADNMFRVVDAAALGMGTQKTVVGMAGKVKNFRPIVGGMHQSGTVLDDLGRAAARTTDGVDGVMARRSGQVVDKGAPGGNPIFDADELAWARKFADEGHDVYAIPGSQVQRQGFIGDDVLQDASKMGKYKAATPKAADSYISGIGQVDFKKIGPPDPAVTTKSIDEIFEGVIQKGLKETPPRSVRTGNRKPTTDFTAQTPRVPKSTPDSRLGGVTQSPNYAVDVRGSGLTAKQASEAMQRLQQSNPDMWQRLQSVRVWGDGYDFVIQGGKQNRWLFRN